MAAVGGATTLADYLELDCDIGDISLEVATKLAGPMKMTKLAKPDWAVDKEPTCTIEGLPTLPNAHQKPDNTTVSHIVDCIMGHQEAFDQEAILSNMMQNAIGDLPEILKPKSRVAVGFVMNVAILNTNDDKCNIIKHFFFEEQISLRQAKDIPHNDPAVPLVVCLLAVPLVVLLAFPLVVLLAVPLVCPSVPWSSS
jgi:hypothetical protein